MLVILIFYAKLSHFLRKIVSFFTQTPVPLNNPVNNSPLVINKILAIVNLKQFYSKKSNYLHFDNPFLNNFEILVLSNISLFILWVLSLVYLNRAYFDADLITGSAFSDDCKHLAGRNHSAIAVSVVTIQFCS